MFSNSPYFRSTYVFCLIYNTFFTSSRFDHDSFVHHALHVLDTPEHTPHTHTTHLHTYLHNYTHSEISTHWYIHVGIYMLVILRHYKPQCFPFSIAHRATHFLHPSMFFSASNTFSHSVAITL